MSRGDLALLNLPLGLGRTLALSFGDLALGEIRDSSLS